MASPFVVGVDPALDGAALLLDADGARIVWTWKQVTRSGLAVFRLATIRRGPDGARATARTVPTLGHVGDRIAADVWDATAARPVRLWSEATHVRFVTAAISIEGSAGRVLGPIERYAVGWSAVRIRAAEWRRRLLRMGSFTSRVAAKAAAADFVPPLVPGLSGMVERLRLDLGGDRFDPEHIFDAAGVAACAQREAEWREESGSPTKRSSRSGVRGSRVKRGRTSAGSTTSGSG